VIKETFESLPIALKILLTVATRMVVCALAFLKVEKRKGRSWKFNLLKE